MSSSWSVLLELVEELVLIMSPTGGRCTVLFVTITSEVELLALK